MDKGAAIGEVFQRIFGAGDRIVIVEAPGRVNLIGEHTDYNEGFVLPIAINFKMRMAARSRPDSVIKIYSGDYQQTSVFSLDDPVVVDASRPWSNYPRGVVWALREAGFKLQGFEMAFDGDLPQGAGLSSSAALEIATAVMLKELFGFQMSAAELVLLCQRAENEFVGMKCGIMDQFISLMGKADRALFLDCRSLDYQYVPLKLGDYRIVICHSGVKHSLVASEYNRRRQDCQAGVTVLQSRFNGVKALRDVNLEQLQQCADQMDETVYRRCRHVISENERVLQSLIALEQGNLEQFGKLMNESHDSQRDDFEVSCPEVDLLVDLARAVPKVLGARITGGGFGGCTVNLVAGEAIARFREEVVEAYRLRSGKIAQLFVCTPADGAKRLNV